MRALLRSAMLAWTFSLGVCALPGDSQAEVVFRRGNDAEPESLDPTGSAAIGRAPSWATCSWG